MEKLRQALFRYCWNNFRSESVITVKDKMDLAYTEYDEDDTAHKGIVNFKSTLHILNDKYVIEGVVQRYDGSKEVVYQNMFDLDGICEYLENAHFDDMIAWQYNKTLLDLGRGMTIVMKEDSTDKQMETAKKMYPYAEVKRK